MDFQEIGRAFVFFGSKKDSRTEKAADSGSDLSDKPHLLVLGKPVSFFSEFPFPSSFDRS